jgi:hypothetical protein
MRTKEIRHILCSAIPQLRIDVQYVVAICLTEPDRVFHRKKHDRFVVDKSNDLLHRYHSVLVVIDVQEPALSKPRPFRWPPLKPGGD